MLTSKRDPNPNPDPLVAGIVDVPEGGGKFVKEIYDSHIKNTSMLGYIGMSFRNSISNTALSLTITLTTTFTLTLTLNLKWETRLYTQFQW